MIMATARLVGSASPRFGYAIEPGGERRVQRPQQAPHPQPAPLATDPIAHRRELRGSAAACTKKMTLHPRVVHQWVPRRRVHGAARKRGPFARSFWSVNFTPGARFAGVLGHYDRVQGKPTRDLGARRTGPL